MFWKFTVTFENVTENYREETETGILHSENETWESAAKELDKFYGNSLITVHLEQLAPYNVLIGFSEDELNRVKEEVIW